MTRVAVRSYRTCVVFAQQQRANADPRNCANQPILTTWGAVEVNDDLETMVARPPDRFLQVRQLAGYVGLARSNLERPVPDGNTDEVEADIGADDEREAEK